MAWKPTSAASGTASSARRSAGNLQLASAISKTGVKMNAGMASTGKRSSSPIAAKLSATQNQPPRPSQRRFGIAFAVRAGMELLKSTDDSMKDLRLRSEERRVGKE